MRIPDLDPANWTILVVDDEEDNLDVAQQVLEFYGAQVLLAGSGQQAIETLEARQVSIMLLDLSMPEMDGWEVVEKVRQNPHIQQTIIIALTAHAMKGDQDRAMKSGFNGYITKPFYMDTLIESIQTCLKNIS
jgi:two-component system cell cycle response regulator DivK